MTDPSQRPTLTEVALRAHVSRATASSAFTGHGRISDATRDAVLEAARELGYRPDPRGRYLRTAAAPLITVIYNQLPDGSEQHSIKHFWQRAFESFVQELDRAEMAAIMVPLTQASYLQHLPSAAIIVVSNERGELDIARHCPPGTPRVLAGMTDSPTRFDATITPDYPGLIRQALDHLSDRGSVRPALAMVPIPMAPISFYSEAYEQWCQAHNVMPRAAVASQLAPAVMGLIADGADSVIILPDDGVPDVESVLRGIAESGRSIPGDIMLVSISDGQRETANSPTVTSVSTPAQATGVLAAQAVIDGVRTGSFKAATIPFVLTQRESTDRAVVAGGGQ